jgi:hypothetical protein
MEVIGVSCPQQTPTAQRFYNSSSIPAARGRILLDAHRVRATSTL